MPRYATETWIYLLIVYKANTELIILSTRSTAALDGEISGPVNKK